MLMTVQPLASASSSALSRRPIGGGPVISPFALGIGVVDERHEAGPAARRRPLEHLVVAVGVAEGGDGAPPDLRMDADGLPGLVVNRNSFRQADEHRFGRRRSSYLVLMLLPTTCSGGMP